MLKKRLLVTEKTQEALIKFLLDTIPRGQVQKIERFFINAFNDWEIPEEAVPILEVIQAFDTEKYQETVRKYILKCFYEGF